MKNQELELITIFLNNKKMQIWSLTTSTLSHVFNKSVFVESLIKHNVSLLRKYEELLQQQQKR